MTDIFDIALERRFAQSPEIATINVTSADTLLIRDSATGVVMRMPFSTLAAAISSAFGGSFATLVDGKVPASQLPSYVDDVLEYATLAAFPATGETGKIYITLDTNLAYRWSGSTYVNMPTSLALGETSATAYRGDRGKTAYDHSQFTSGNPHAVTKSDVGLGNVDNTSDANKPISTAQQTALDGKTSMCGFPVDSSGNYLVSLSYNETTRTVSLTPTGATFDVYVAGVKYTKTGAQSVVHGAQQDGHFVYYDNTGTLVTSQSVWDLAQTAPVAFVFRDATNSMSIPFFELHHAGMDVWAHRRLHEVDGTQIVSGYAVSGYTASDGSSDAAVTFAVASGVIADEDIHVTTQALADGGPYWILERVGGTGTWQVTRANTVPFFHASNVLQYNQFTGGVWQRSNVPEDNYVNYWVFAVPALPTTSITPALSSTPQIVIVPGQTVYSTETAAHGETPASLSWGTVPFQEIAPLFQVTLRYNANPPSAYTNTARCAITRLVRVVGSRATITAQAQTDHGTLSGLSDKDHPASAIINTPAGNISATDVQGAIDELDSEKAAILQEAWIAPTLLNSWVDYGGSQPVAEYMKDTLGFVHLKGLVKSGTLFNPIFTLPVGYRPTERLLIATASNDAFGWVAVETNGNVIANVGSNVWFSLCNISFKV